MDRHTADVPHLLTAYSLPPCPRHPSSKAAPRREEQAGGPRSPHRPPAAGVTCCQVEGWKEGESMGGNETIWHDTITTRLRLTWPNHKTSSMTKLSRGYHMDTQTAIVVVIAMKGGGGGGEQRGHKPYNRRQTHRNPSSSPSHNLLTPTMSRRRSPGHGKDR